MRDVATRLLDATIERRGELSFKNMDDRPMLSPATRSDMTRGEAICALAIEHFGHRTEHAVDHFFRVLL